MDNEDFGLAKSFTTAPIGIFAPQIDLKLAEEPNPEKEFVQTFTIWRLRAMASALSYIQLRTKFNFNATSRQWLQSLQTLQRVQQLLLSSSKAVCSLLSMQELPKASLSVQTTSGKSLK